MKTLILLVAAVAVLDYVTGVLSAAKCRMLSSSRGLRGIYRKLALFCALALGFFLDAAIPYLASYGLSKEFTVNLPFGLLIASWVVLSESISVLENLTCCGVKLPGIITRVLKTAQKKVEGDEGDEDRG
jgi:toxin secretion/phage lysis holin